MKSFKLFCEDYTRIMRHDKDVQTMDPPTLTVSVAYLSINDCKRESKRLDEVRLMISLEQIVTLNVPCI